MNKLFHFLILFCVIPYMVQAQTLDITGKVTEARNGATLPGVTVRVSNNVGTMTDIDGNYSIKANKGDVITFSFIGMVTENIKVGTNSIIDVAMQEDSRALDEVVVVGYGTMKKSDISGASISVGEDAIKGSVIANLDQALQGRAAGVTSVMTSGAPGSAVSIRVRGTATLNAYAEPLYVVDGVILQGQSLGGTGNANSTSSPLATINPSDIVSMEVLKDASATAIYGAQGSNGVVLITTKRGKRGEAKFSYDGYAGVNIQNKRLKMMNLREYAEFNASTAAELSSKPATPEYQDPSLLGAGTNWQDAIFQHALIQQHQVSAEGGTDNVRYYVSGGYMGQEGTILATDFKRYSFRVNLDADLKKWLRLGVNAMYASTDERFGLANGSEGMLTYSLVTPPDMPVYDIDGNYATVVREGWNTINPIAMAMMTDNTANRQKLTGSIFLDIKPIKNLIWHSELGFDFSHSKQDVFNPTYSFGDNISKKINDMTETMDNNTYWQLTNTLTYSGNYKKHAYTVMAGEEIWESKYNNLVGFGSGLPSNDVHSLSLSDPDSQTTRTGFGSTSMASFFARATYNYDERYLATVTHRIDGSSNFGPKKRWANFSSFALSWRFSNEAFLKDNKVLSNGKLRFGWGQTGNANIPGYAWGSRIQSIPTDLGIGYRQYNIANPYVQWETQEQWNLGLDLGFFGNRINLTIDAYDKTSEDMLWKADYPSYMGTKGNDNSKLNAPWGNYGTINNKGFEISLNTVNLRGGAFEWDTDLQISFNKNKLVSLPPGTPPVMGYPQWGGQGAPITYTEPGQPLFNFYGFVTDGYYKDKADIENSPKPVAYKGTNGYNVYNTVWVGDIKYKDISGPDGTPDGLIDDYDRTHIGSPLPTFTFGMNNSFRYKNFDLSIFINGSLGNKVYNYTAVDLSSVDGYYRNQLQLVTNRARLEPIDPDKTYDGTNTGVWNWFEDIDNVRLANNPSVPRASNGDPNDNTRISDRYIEDGSYLRIKNIIFGYTVPAGWIRKYGLGSLRVYTNIQNLLTFTSYTGYDPEIGANTMTPNVFGMDYGRYPSPQSFTFGLNISF